MGQNNQNVRHSEEEGAGQCGVRLVVIVHEREKGRRRYRGCRIDSDLQKGEKEEAVFSGNQQEQPGIPPDAMALRIHLSDALPLFWGEVVEAVFLL